MNNQYSNEDLLHSLPDYIANKLTDTDLKNAIEMKISSDPDFKMEFRSLTNTINLLGHDNTELPSDTYFNNLSVRINKAINKENQPVSFFERFGIYLKFALPALAVILVIMAIFLYKPSLTNDSDITNNITNENSIDDKTDKTTEENIPADKNTVRTEVNNNLTEQIDKNSIDPNDPKIKKEKIKDKKIESVSQQSESFDIFTDTDESVFSGVKKSYSVTFKDSAFEDLALAVNTNSNTDPIDNNSELKKKIDITDNSESELEQEGEILISGDSDDDFFEDLFELTPEEQLEIVKYLKQS